ncbi:MAG: TlpA family protein disulfide reductase [Dysgonamonadaceae bacterium]|jgi:peroxiredoxin|nr:TlpA family protein disulfide reductase [Dysgonamonadaceae bacterium]
MTKHVLFGLFAIVMLASCNNSSKRNNEASITIEAEQVTEPTVYEHQYLVKVGDMAPDFEMEMPDGQKVRLSSLRGKVVMLQFTASWCGVCRRKMPYIESEIWQRYKDNLEFALYGIARGDTPAQIEAMRVATKVTYPIGMDPEGDIFGLYAEKDAGITRNIIIDRAGRIVELTRLFEMDEFNEMVELIDKLLSQQ